MSFARMMTQGLGQRMCTSALILPNKINVKNNVLHNALKRRLLVNSSVIYRTIYLSGATYSNSSNRPRTSLSQQQLNALRFKTRKSKKKNIPGKGEWSVVGYSVAKSFDMIGLQEGLYEQLIYNQIELEDELNGSCVCVTNKYATDQDELLKEIFFFKDGNVIFWNVPELERNNVIRFLSKHSMEEYDEDIIYEESELMNFTFCDTLNNPVLEKGLIRLNPDLDSFQLDKYTFSDAIASSVNLGTWEAALDKIIDSIEHISEDLKTSAHVKISNRAVLQKSGEILALRHMINFSSDLLDAPDFYWDREGLENLYLATCSHLAVKRRTNIVNEKLNHCLELLDLVSTHQSTEHGARLEWIIIILIAIEIGFEVLHLADKKYEFKFLHPREK